jgi:hypothetical protein
MEYKEFIERKKQIVAKNWQEYELAIKKIVKELGI